MDFLNFQELYHHGIKGQKWGIRRYTDENGNVTKEGRAHYKQDKNIMDNTGKLVGQIKDAIPVKQGKTTHGDYSKISDDELRKRVNRLNMEEQYARLTGDNKYVKSGAEKAREVLQTVGSVIAIAGTATAIGFGIYDRRHHK